MLNEYLDKNTPASPEHCVSEVKNEVEDLYCPRCGYYYYLHNVWKMRNKICGFCGQTLDWSEFGGWHSK